jgi:hypothetical protein
MFESLEENEPKEQKPTDWSGVIIAAILAPVYIFFIWIGKEDLGLSVFICLGMTVLAIKIRWDLRKCFWFWGVIILILALHVPLILRLRWSGLHVTRISLLPIGVADLAITLGVVGFVEKFIVKAPPADEGE